MLESKNLTPCVELLQTFSTDNEEELKKPEEGMTPKAIHLNRSTHQRSSISSGQLTKGHPSHQVNSPKVIHLIRYIIGGEVYIIS
jgi:hypothetical protein